MFKEPIRQLSDNLHALRDFTTLLAPFLVQQEQQTYSRHFQDLLPLTYAFKEDDKDEGLEKSLEEFEARYGDKPSFEFKDQGDNKKSVSISMPAEAGSAFHSALRSIHLSASRKELLYKSSLISLISSIEWFLCQIFKVYFEKFPDALGGNDKVFSLNDLKAFGSIEDSVKALVEAKVENIMRGSFEDWIKFLKQNVRLSMGYLDRHIEELSEVFQRRNIIVHNGSRVNSIYISKVSPRLRTKLSIGQDLEIDESYLGESINRFEGSFILIAAEFWKQLEPEAIDRAETLNDISFQHLQAERWTVSESLSHFIKNDKKMPERQQLIGQINYWQSLKWQGRYNEIKDEAEKADFSAKDGLFQLAIYALTEKNRVFFELLPKIIDTEKLSYESLETWPIFRQMRQDLQYEVFRQERKTEFDKICQSPDLKSRKPPKEL